MLNKVMINNASFTRANLTSNKEWFIHSKSNTKYLEPSLK